MNDIIYFQAQNLGIIDKQLHSKDYKHNKWFNVLTVGKFLPFLQSRVHKLDTPWNLTTTVCPIPSINDELRFDVVIESIADSFCKRIHETGRTPYICWSGGIDSTSILTSILKVADKAFLDNLVVLCDIERSVKENSYFYYKFLDQKIKVQDITKFSVNEHNYNKLVLVDGEVGNQCMGATTIHTMSYKREYDILHANWRTTDKEKFLARKGDLDSYNFALDIVEESIRHCPLEIVTVYDYLWWLNFNFNTDDVLLRKMAFFTGNLTQEQSKDFWDNSMYRFYADPRMQAWSLASMDLRHSFVELDPKYHSKKYIYDFDKNDLYWSNKREETSIARLDLPYDVFAIDANWRKYSLKNPSDCRALGQLLERI
jgi:hypothetical protein